MSRSSNSAAIRFSLVGLLAAIVGIVVGIALELVFSASRLVIRLLWPTLRARRAAAAPTPPRVERVGQDYSEYEPSVPRRVQLHDIGYVTLWAFQSRGVVVRQLVITDTALAQKVGVSRTPLPERKWPRGMSLDVIEGQAIQDAKAFLKGRRGRNFDLVSTGAGAAAQAEADLQEKPTGKRQPVPAFIHAPDPKNRLQAKRGVLKFAGLAERTLKGKTTEQFAVDVVDPQIGVQRMWGVDLPRALKDSGAVEGDVIEVVCTGRTPVTLPGGDVSQKNLYTVKVLN